VIRVSGASSGRVSIAGLACYRPGHRAHLYYRVLVHHRRKGERRSFAETDYATAITAAHQQLRAPLIVVWDNLNTHTSAAMREFAAAHQKWLTLVRLPAYAPELNPVEGVWANLKNGLATSPPTVSTTWHRSCAADSRPPSSDPA
jgi:transposase